MGGGDVGRVADEIIGAGYRDGTSVEVEDVCGSIDRELGGCESTGVGEGALAVDKVAVDKVAESEGATGVGFLGIRKTLERSPGPNRGDEEGPWGTRGGRRRMWRSACTVTWSGFDTVKTWLTLFQCEGGHAR